MERRLKLTLPALAGAILLAGCAAPPAPPGYPVPPPLPAEILPLPPVSDAPLVFQPGDWVFTGGSYRYEAGHYVPAAGHSRNWMFGRWAPNGTPLPVWVPGHWV